MVVTSMVGAMRFTRPLRTAPEPSSYARVTPGPGASLVRSQTFFEALARSDYRDTALENRTKPAPAAAKPA